MSTKTRRGEPVYADPHRPLWLDDPQPWPNEAMYPFARGGFSLWKTSAGWMALKGTKLVMPSSIVHRLRSRMWLEQGGLCAYCQRPTVLEFPEEPREQTWGIAPSIRPECRANFATIEHRTPLSRGGTWKRNNLCIACAQCDGLKLDCTAEEFIPILRKFPPEPSGRWIARVRGTAKNHYVARQKAAAAARAKPDQTDAGTSNSVGKRLFPTERFRHTNSRSTNK